MTFEGMKGIGRRGAGGMRRGKKVGGPSKNEIDGKQ